MVRSAHFSLIPLMVAREPAGADDRAPVLLALRRTHAGEASCAARWRSRRSTYYQLWHDLTHASPSVRWLREQVREVARNLVDARDAAAAAQPARTDRRHEA